MAPAYLVPRAADATRSSGHVPPGRPPRRPPAQAPNPIRHRGGGVLAAAVRRPVTRLYLALAATWLAFGAGLASLAGDLRFASATGELVLDDSGRDAVRHPAAAAGFDYLSRPDRGRLKKAGNLAFGYARSSGDLRSICASRSPAPRLESSPVSGASRVRTSATASAA